jgi:hypothetical protein
MSDNVLQTLQQLVQDVIAPDVRELKVRLPELEKRMDVRFNQVDSRFSELEELIKSNHAIVMAAIGQMKDEGEVIALREIGVLRERVAVLEATKH